MYKYLILGISVFVLGGAGYYFNSSGGSGLINKALYQEDTNKQGVSYTQLFSGTYECAEDTGCKTSTHLSLQEDETFSLTSAAEDGGEDVVVNGTWGIAKNNALVLLLQRSKGLLKNYPPSITANKIDTVKISQFSKKNLSAFPSIVDPSFVRISND